MRRILGAGNNASITAWEGIMADNFTLRDLDAYSELYAGVRYGRTLVWETEGGRVNRGVLREFVNKDGLRWNVHTEDVRDAYVRVSGMVELFLRVADVIDLLRGLTGDAVIKKD